MCVCVLQNVVIHQRDLAHQLHVRERTKYMRMVNGWKHMHVVPIVDVHQRNRTHAQLSEGEHVGPEPRALQCIL